MFSIPTLESDTLSTRLREQSFDLYTVVTISCKFHGNAGCKNLAGRYETENHQTHKSCRFAMPRLSDFDVAFEALGLNVVYLQTSIALGEKESRERCYNTCTQQSVITYIVHVRRPCTVRESYIPNYSWTYTLTSPIHNFPCSSS